MKIDQFAGVKDFFLLKHKSLTLSSYEKPLNSIPKISAITKLWYLIPKTSLELLYRSSNSLILVGLIILIFGNDLIKDEGWLIIETDGRSNFLDHPKLYDHRTYGGSHFWIFEWA